jgi:5,10-methylenetetrahydromethanopterin reductase
LKVEEDPSIIQYTLIFKEKTMTERVALYLQDSHDLRDGMEYAKYAEEKGFEAVWQAESRLVRDAIVPMAAYAAVTTKLKVGSGVINNWTRNIGLLAATFLTLDDLAPNRVICGIGAWWDPLAKNVGIDRRKPLLAMRETVEVMRRLLNMERVTFHGEFHHVDGIELDVVHGRREPRNVPIMIGATGDLMMEMTGEIADGCVMNYCVAPEYNDKALELLEKGAEKAGRKIEDIDRPQLIVCSVDEDHDKAIEYTKELLCQYLAQQPHIAKASNVSQEVIGNIQATLGWPATKEQINKAKHFVPDDLVHKITASGTPAEARAKVAEYTKRGCTCPILYPFGGNFKLLIDTFAQK